MDNHFIQLFQLRHQFRFFIPARTSHDPARGLTSTDIVELSGDLTSKKLPSAPMFWKTILPEI